ncbi:MAG: DUF6261 family protein [Bacteroidales bacterium]|jgi:hypothetical protein|nr:DUF6261 family protein [Bacteroidales bacterium]
MNIKNIRIYLLSLALHLQFLIEVMNLIRKFGPDVLEIQKLYDTLCAAIKKEELCHKVVRKSNISDLKQEVDLKRDNLVLGIKDALKSALRHFDNAIRAAAHRLKIVFDTYNKPTPIIHLPYDAETKAVNDMLKEFETKYAEDIEITGLTPWIKELQTCNNEFENLEKSYTEQRAEKPAFQTKEARKESDKAYRDIVYVVNGNIISKGKEGETQYATFVAEINAIIKRYNDRIAQHLGHLHAEKEKENEGDN